MMIQAKPGSWYGLFLFVVVALTFFYGPLVEAKPRASVKFSSIRAENPKMAKEVLVLPYGFPSESMGTTFGIGGGVKGYGQDQMLIAGTAFASADEAKAVVLGLWDYRLPKTKRLFFSAIGSAGYYPRQRAYSENPTGYTGVRSGDNDSDKDDFIEDEGDDNWWEMKLEFVLPIGAVKNDGMTTYHLKGGQLVSGGSGGEEWNPLESGVSVFVIRQFNRYQKYETDEGDIDGTIHPVEFGLLYNNTDFAPNPSSGSSQYISYTQDFGWLESDQTWNFLDFEASKYFSLGESDNARQRVLALNFWTGHSPSWDLERTEEGNTVIRHRPPFFEGSKLGGFYRLRAYPNNRFNDRSVIYSTAELRYTPWWNPIGELRWLRWLKMDWMQLVGFVEGGRVAPDYEFDELFSDWKADAGLGFRAMMAGGIVRFDFAVSEEGSAGWVMFGQPF